jgi:hypothetical protein
MALFPFGNDPAKIERYKAFWGLDEVTRPLVGFSFADWFGCGYFRTTLQWPG